MNKTEMQAGVRESRGRMNDMLDGLTEEDAARVGLNANWAIKDALAHVVAWERQGAQSVNEILNGTYQQQKLDKETINAFNARATEERRGRTLAELREEMQAAQSAIDSAIALLPEEADEATAGAFKFVEIVSARHYAQHAAQIEEWRQKMSGNTAISEAVA